MDTTRKKGIAALSTVLGKESNVRILEKALFEASSEDAYVSNIYQAIGDILQEKSLKTVLANIKSGKINWNHESYDNIRYRIEEQDEFIVNPFVVEEGVLQCKKCGSKRVFSYSKQDRSCDEGTSVYAQCFACKTQWRERG